MMAGIVDKKKKEAWQVHTNYIIPKNSLGYASEEAFLVDKKLTKEQIIKNSILYIHPKMNKERVEYLSEWFKIIVKKHRIRVTRKDKVAVYSEILFILSYIDNIKALIDKYPKNWSNYYGTKFRASSENNLVKTQLNYLKECLNNPFFPILNKKEREKISCQIRFLKESLKPENKGISEIFNHSDSVFGINHKLMKFSKLEQDTIKQIMSFYNGIRCKKEELVKSAKLMMRQVSNMYDKADYEELAKCIENIAYDFFDYVYQESKKKSESKDKKIKKESAYKQLIFTKKQLSNDIHVKTNIDGVKIYTYTHSSTFDYEKNMNEAVLRSIYGIKNMFEPNLPTLQNTTNFHLLRHSLKFKKEMGFTKKELQYFNLSIWQAYREQILLELSNTSN